MANDLPLLDPLFRQRLIFRLSAVTQAPGRRVAKIRVSFFSASSIIIPA